MDHLQVTGLSDLGQFVPLIRKVDAFRVCIPCINADRMASLQTARQEEEAAAAVSPLFQRVPFEALGI